MSRKPPAALQGIGGGRLAFSLVLNRQTPFLPWPGSISDLSIGASSRDSGSFIKAAGHLLLLLLLQLRAFTSLSPKPPTAFRFPGTRRSQAAKDSESNTFCWFNCSCTSHLEFHFTNCRCAALLAKAIYWKSRLIGANKSHTFECKNTNPGF